MQESAFSRGVLVRGAILAVLNVIVFGQATSFEFVDWDDLRQVMNRVDQFEGISVESVRWAFSNHVGGWMTPLSWLSLLIDRQLFGMNSGGYHFTNMVLHILTTWCMCAALTCLTSSPTRSFLVACLFAVHPLHVEPVAWVTGRWELVAGLFWATGLLAWSYYVRTGSRWSYLATMSSFIAAVLGKPMALTFPFVLLLLDYWPLHRLKFSRPIDSETTQERKVGERSLRVRDLFIEKVPFFATMIVLAVLSISVKKGATEHAHTEQFSMIAKLGNAVQTYAFYVWQTLWPHDLVCFYPHPASIGQLSMFSVISAFAVVAAITVGVLIIARVSGQLGFLVFGWLYYLGTFVPAIGIVQVELYATADRYTYLPLTGLLIMGVWGLAALCDRLRVTTNVRRNGVVFGLALLVIVSCRQCTTWRNSDTLWTHAATARASNYRAHSVLAYLSMRQGDLAGAEAHAAESVRLCPQYAYGPIQLGVVRLNQRRPDEAVELFRLGLRHAPGLVKPRIALGKALRESGQVSASIEELEQVLAMAPSNELAAKELAISKAIAEPRQPATDQQKELLKSGVSDRSGEDVRPKAGTTSIDVRS